MRVTQPSKFPDAPVSDLSLCDQMFSVPFVSLEALKEKLRSVGLSTNGLVEAALAQAQHSHRDQKRDGGGPYLEQHVYPVTVSVIDHERRCGLRVAAKLVATALTHDVPEDDRSMPLPRFKDVFGTSSTHVLKPLRSVADFVDPLTKRRPEEYAGETPAERRRARDDDYHQKLLAAQRETKLVKLADNDNNIHSIHKCSPEKIERKIAEAESIYLPLAARVSPSFFRSIANRVEFLKRMLQL